MIILHSWYLDHLDIIINNSHHSQQRINHFLTAQWQSSLSFNSKHWNIAKPAVAHGIWEPKFWRVAIQRSFSRMTQCLLAVQLQSYQGGAVHEIEMPHCILLYTKQRSTGLWAFQLLCHPSAERQSQRLSFCIYVCSHACLWNYTSELHQSLGAYHLWP